MGREGGLSLLGEGTIQCCAHGAWLQASPRYTPSQELGSLEISCTAGPVKAVPLAATGAALMGVGFPHELPSSCNAHARPQQAATLPFPTLTHRVPTPKRAQPHLPHHILDAIHRVPEKRGVDGTKTVRGCRLHQRPTKNVNVRPLHSCGAHSHAHHQLARLQAVRHKVHDVIPVRGVVKLRGYRRNQGPRRGAQGKEHP